MPDESWKPCRITWTRTLRSPCSQDRRWEQTVLEIPGCSLTEFEISRVLLLAKLEGPQTKDQFSSADTCWIQKLRRTRSMSLERVILWESAWVEWGQNNLPCAELSTWRAVPDEVVVKQDRSSWRMSPEPAPILPTAAVEDSISPPQCPQDWAAPRTNVQWMPKVTSCGPKQRKPPTEARQEVILMLMSVDRTLNN